MNKALLAKLAKATDTLTNHVRRGATQHASRSLALIDRYNDLKDAAASDEWAFHCERFAFSQRHDAYDFFA
jgi:hypothetical protein